MYAPTGHTMSRLISNKILLVVHGGNPRIFTRYLTDGKNALPHPPSGGLEDTDKVEWLLQQAGLDPPSYIRT